MGGRKRLGFVLAAVAAVLLLAAGAALADNYQYRFTSADQAAARSAVLSRSDLPALNSWKGGSVKPDESPQTEKDRCNGYIPKESDLVVTGDSETKYSLNGFTIDTQATVFRSAAMVDTDWKRQPTPSEMLKCMHDQWATAGPKGTTFVSGRMLSLPHLGTHLLALQITFAGSFGVGKQPVHAVMDMIVFSRGRTEIMIAAGAPVASSSDIAIIKAVSARVAGILGAKLQLPA
jgi:hypothetical protein